MTVAELIEHLKTFPQDLPVAFQCYSEQALMKPGDIAIKQCQPPRKDGWVHDARPDRPSVPYLVFPGN